MKMSLLVTSGTTCISWPWMLDMPPTRPRRNAFSWSTPSYLQLKQGEPELQKHTDQLPTPPPRQIKRARMNRAKVSPGSIQSPQEEVIFDARYEFQLPEIRVTKETPACLGNTGQSLNLGAGFGEYNIAASMTNLASRTSLSYAEAGDSSESYDNMRLQSPPLPVSPLEPPSDFLDRFNSHETDMQSDTREIFDQFFRGGGNEDEEALTPAHALDQSVAETCYPLERYLAGDELTQPRDSSSISCAALEASVDSARTDIISELERFDCDISDALASMNLDAESDSVMRSEFSNPESKQEPHVASSDIAGYETENQQSENSDNRFGFGVDDNLVVRPRCISPALEAWMSKSSLIVGQSLKPLEENVNSTGFLPEENILKGRKRKASTCGQ